MATGKDIKAHSARSQEKDEARDLKSQANEKSNRAKKREFKLEPGQSVTTTNHGTIRQWIEARGGKPAMVGTNTVGTTAGKDDTGLLRIDYPGRRSENRLEALSWEEFFDKFEEKGLAFLYQEQTRTGRVSRFCKFVSREGKK